MHPKVYAVLYEFVPKCVCVCVCVLGREGKSGDEERARSHGDYSGDTCWIRAWEKKISFLGVAVEELHRC